MIKKAKAAVFVGVEKPFEIQEFPLTMPEKGMAQIELMASGICGTDIHFHKGRLSIATPTVIGHEFVGKIVQLNPADTHCGYDVGDHVIVDIAVPCGECLLCKTGDDANCIHMKVTNGGDIHVAPYLYGGYVEMNYSPISNLIKLPKDLDAEMVCTFACPGPTALHAFRLAREANIDFKNIKTAVVQGLGPVGVFAVLYLKSLGIENIMAITAGTNEKREKLALELGANTVLNLTRSSEKEITDFVIQAGNGMGADLVFEASGSPKAVPQGFDMLRNRGAYLIPGQYSNSGGIEIQPQLITFKALRIIGSSQYSILDVENYVSFLLEHPALHSQIKELGNRYKIDDVNQAFDDAKLGNNIKTMIVK